MTASKNNTPRVRRGFFRGVTYAALLELVGVGVLLTLFFLLAVLA